MLQILLYWTLLQLQCCNVIHYQIIEVMLTKVKKLYHEFTLQPKNVRLQKNF